MPPFRPVLHDDVLNLVELWAGMGVSAFGKQVSISVVRLSGSLRLWICTVASTLVSPLSILTYVPLMPL